MGDKDSILFSTFSTFRISSRMGILGEHISISFFNRFNPFISGSFGESENIIHFYVQFFDKFMNILTVFKNGTIPNILLE